MIVCLVCYPWYGWPVVQAARCCSDSISRWTEKHCSLIVFWCLSIRRLTTHWISTGVWFSFSILHRRTKVDRWYSYITSSKKTISPVAQQNHKTGCCWFFFFGGGGAVQLWDIIVHLNISSEDSVALNSAFCLERSNSKRIQMVALN